MHMSGDVQPRPNRTELVRAASQCEGSGLRDTGGTSRMTRLAGRRPSYCATVRNQTEKKERCRTDGALPPIQIRSVLPLSGA